MKQSINFTHFLQNELNPPQREAIELKNGPILVIAGAGSGKTRVITARIVNLIQNYQVAAENIIALTFTNKAAQEMKERILNFLPNLENLPFIGTFHSYCLQLLKKNQKLLNLENFTILDDDDQTKLLKLILSKFALEKKVNLNNLQYQISIFKNSQVVDEPFAPPDRLGVNESGPLVVSESNHTNGDKLFQDVFTAYEKEKRTNKSLDFDDLLIEVVKLFRKNKSFKENFQNKIKHVLVDEYQDTNHVQHELLKELTKDGNKIVAESICAVGDEDQSIYSWRGATVDNILHFKKDFPGTKLIKIEQNYRSVNQILEVANHVIENNKNRNPKKLWSEKKANNRIARLINFSGFKEADMIANFVKIAHKFYSNQSTAVLYRTHFQSRVIEEILLKNGIAYKIIGGIQFYERKEIKDIIAYLKLIVNPFDKVSFLRVINCPTRNLGKKSEELFYEYWQQEPLLDFHQITKKLISEKIFTGNKAASLEQFANIIASFKASHKPSETIKSLLEKIEYLTFLRTEFEKSEYEQKVGNINEFIRAAIYAEEKNISSIEAFLEDIALMQEKLQEQENKVVQVQLMTLHAAKGLEFDNVILSGLEDGLFPSQRSLEDPNAIEEERRLFYVGITRAKERLIFSNALTRSTFGSTNSQIMSRFLTEIPKNLVYEQDCSYWSEYEFQNFFAQFLGIKNVDFKPSVKTFGPKPDSSGRYDQQSWPIKNEHKNKAKDPSCPFKKNHFVSHPTFGTGIIKEIEEKPNRSITLNIYFKTHGMKKIDSKFVTIV